MTVITPSKMNRIGAWLLGLVALLPLVLLREDFARLFAFGDEWDQLDRIDSWGFWKWVAGSFAENYTPVFKTIWGGVLLLTHGWFFGSVIFLWIVHALVTVTFATVLRSLNFGWIGTCLATLVFALSWTNHETLAWTIQLMFVLSMLFFLLAFLAWSEGEATPARIALVFGLLLASAFSSSRGVVSGGAIVAAMLFGLVWADRGAERHVRKSLAMAGLWLIPGIISFVAIVMTASGNHTKFGTEAFPIGKAAGYGLATYLLNPLFLTLGFETPGWRLVGWLGLLKIAIIVGGFRLADKTQRRLLVALIVLDLASSILLGVGRFHKGLPTAVSSRYQYYPLICLMPFVAVLVDRAFAKLRARSTVKAVTATALIIAVVWAIMRPWWPTMSIWSRWRGDETRYLIFEAENPPERGAIKGIPSMPTARAKELVQRFDLK